MIDKPEAEEAVFYQAIELDWTEREAFLDEACGNDARI